MTRSAKIMTVSFVAVLAALALCGPAWAVEGMISYWTFNDGTADDLLGINHGTIYGATWTTGQVDGALSFDGTDDYVSVPQISLGDFTIEAWFKATSAPGTWSRIFDGGVGHYGVVIITPNHGRTGGDIGFTILDTTGGAFHEIGSGVTVTVGQWYYVAIAHDKGGTGMKLYVNGVLTNSDPYNTESFDDWDVSQNWYIGKSNWSQDPYFPGIIDEVAIYNRLLTLEEIQQHYENGLNGYGYLPVDPKIIAITKINRAIAEKIEALERIDAALEKEWAAYIALEELLASGDYGDLKRGDIVTAKQKIHSAIQHEEQSKNALEKSLQKLEDSLWLLGS